MPISARLSTAPSAKPASVVTGCCVPSTCGRITFILVVSIGEKKPEVALNAFKANATRQIRQDGNWLREHSPWVAKGSKRNLWNERSVEPAIDYVINGQGDDLPDFD